MIGRTGLVTRLVVQHGKIVMGWRVPRIDYRRADERLERHVHLAARRFHECAIDQCVDVARLSRKHLDELGSCFIEPSKPQQRDAKIVAGCEVIRIDRQSPLEFLDGFFSSFCFAVQQAEIVMGLRVQLVLAKHGAVLQQRILDIA